MSEDDRRNGQGGRRSDDLPPDVIRDLARLTAAAGERVAALEDIGTDLASLSGAVDALASAIAMMATKEEVEDVEKRQNRKRVLLGVAVVVLAALLSLPVLYTRQAVDEVRETGDYLVECTTPSPAPEDALDPDDLVHECYEDSLARQAAVVSALNLSTLDAAFCARTSPPEDLETCFVDRIEARTGTRPDLGTGTP